MGSTSVSDTTRRRPPGARAPSSWPFKAAPRVDPAVSEHGVGVPQRQEVEFKGCKQRIWLHRVIRLGVPDLFLRELGEPAAGTIVDLRQLLPDAEKELPGTSTRDVAGYVNFSLRGKFPTRNDFIEAVVRLGRPAA